MMAKEQPTRPIPGARRAVCASWLDQGTLYTLKAPGSCDLFRLSSHSSGEFGVA